ncbi:MAG TPA: hypothetical protein VMW41_05305 [Candidatus Bathyarchaeia archaeon]|nr:hypothetical protein [Candidatus Bathyarchaeia archaeon]
MTNRKYLSIVISISLVAFGLRLYRLGQIPVGFSSSEVALGYRALCLLKSSQGWTAFFRFRQINQSSLYSYLSVIPMLFLGATEFAIRLPAAFLGGLSVFLIYILVKNIFSEFRENRLLATIASLWLTLSFWHYDFSHSAGDANLYLVFLFFGLIFLFWVIQGKKGYFWLALTCFIVAFYVGTSVRLIIFLTFLSFWFIYGKEFLLFNKASLRKYTLVILTIGLLAIIWANSSFPIIKNVVFHTDFHKSFRNFFLKYLNHFSPRFLFFEGDWQEKRFGLPDLGLLNYLDLFLLPIGTYFLINQRIKNQSFLWVLILVSPLSASFSSQAIDSEKAYLLILPLVIISSFGVLALGLLIRKSRIWARCFLSIGLGLNYFFLFVLFWDRYFIHAPVANSQAWQYGYREAVSFVNNRKHSYNQVVFTNKYPSAQFYYYFYTNRFSDDLCSFNPPENTRDNDNLEFRNLYWPVDRFQKKTLYVAATYEIPETDIELQQARILKDIYYLNGELAFRIVETL